MNKQGSCEPVPVFTCILMAALAAADYFLFRYSEHVWPYFVLPYAVFSAVFLVWYLRSKTGNIFLLLLYLLIIIPVFAGLTMSVGWMLNIDFFGEMIRLALD
ncbi:MAG: hypothetical protein IJT24_08255 [Lachnospiraceae bacterium]|nr:hypothetical protein [Lachnospiraceae bacterium]